MMVLNQFGSIPHDTAMYNIKLTTEQVLPKLRHLWPEYEDKWWIKPMRAPQSAGPMYVPQPVAAK